MSEVHAAATGRRPEGGGAEMARSYARFSRGLDRDAVPERVRARALRLVLDGVGIALASHRFDFAGCTLAAARALASGEGRASVIGASVRLPMRDAAMVNGVLVHGLDYDDTHLPGVIHPTASLFPALLALGEHRAGGGRPVAGAELLTAYVAGLECATRIAAAPRGGFHHRGFHPTGLVGAFGCAIGAGRLLGLDEAGMVRAQGIVLSLASGSMQFVEEGAWTKRLHPGWAAVAGLTAACMAEAGFEAPTDPYTGRFGLYALYLEDGLGWPQLDLELATRGLGEDWELEQVAVKPFPACHFVHGAADAALAIARDHGPEPGRIERVVVRVPPETIPTVCEPAARKMAPTSDYDAKFSLQYTVAAALVRGRYGLAELEDEARNDPRIRALARRVDYEADPRSPFPRAYSGEVVVHLRDGAVLRHREHVNRGAGERPLANAEVEEKYLENAALRLGVQGAGRIREAVLGLETCSDVRELGEVLQG